jgi:hypothetical protein
MILCDGRNYQVVPVPEGATPDLIIEEKYQGWIFVDDATATAEANAKIECDRARRRPFSY